MSAVAPKITHRGGSDRLEPARGPRATSGQAVDFRRELDARDPGVRAIAGRPTSASTATASSGSSAALAKDTGRPLDPFKVDQLGSRFSDLRRSLGLTQTEVAQRMGASQPAVARIEKSGEGNSDALPNLVTLERYADALGFDLSVQFDAKSGAKSSAGARAGLPSSVSAVAVCDGLANLRKSLGLMQKDVAAAMFTTQPVIARFEAGGGSPNLRTLERYAGALGIHVRFVLSQRGRS